MPRDAPFPKPTIHGVTCLVVCPTSVVHNWAREFQTVSLGRRVALITHLNFRLSSGRISTWQCTAELHRIESSSSNHFGEATWTLVRVECGSNHGLQVTHQQAPVVIAGIETVRANIAELCLEDFTMVIVDEAHRVKDPRSQTTQALHRFPTALRYGLTGKFKFDQPTWLQTDNRRSHRNGDSKSAERVLVHSQLGSSRQSWKQEAVVRLHAVPAFFAKAHWIVVQGGSCVDTTQGGAKARRDRLRADHRPRTFDRVGHSTFATVLAQKVTFCALRIGRLTCDL